MISVFSKEWFKKYNKVITWVARLPIFGELIFNFKKFGHYVDRKKIVEVTPNSVIEFVKLKGKKKVELKQHFFVRNEYALRLQSVFYPIWITFHIWDIITRPIPQLNLGFDTLTKYPYPADGTANTCDGSVNRSGVNETFLIIRDGAGNASATGGNPIILQINGSATVNQFSEIDRGIVLFNTSSLPDDATIDSTILSVVGTAKFNYIGAADFHICSSTPASNTSLANGDYSNLGTTSFGSIAYADFVANSSTYNDITLNASGLSAISKTGISKFGIRNSWDITGTFGGTWANDTSGFRIKGASAGTSLTPKLVVTYNAVVGPANVKTYKGLAAASVKSKKGLAIASIKTAKGLN